MQTTPLKMGRTAQNRIDGYQLGLSRTGNHHGLSAMAWGSQIPFGRLVVFAPNYNAAMLAGEDNPQRSVMLPSETGEFLINPLDGTPLNAAANSAVLDAAKINGQYLVAGVVFEGDKCDVGYCDQPQPWPVGDYDNLHELNYVQHRRPLTYGTNGYFRVRIGEDLAPGDRLAFLDAYDDADPNVGVQALGSFVKAGNGVQDLPEDWVVITGGKAGTSAEIFINGGVPNAVPAAPVAAS